MKIADKTFKLRVLKNGGEGWTWSITAKIGDSGLMTIRSIHKTKTEAVVDAEKFMKANDFKYEVYKRTRFV